MLLTGIIKGVLCNFLAGERGGAGKDPLLRQCSSRGGSREVFSLQEWSYAM